MTNYVLTYSGGAGLPETQEEQAQLMAAWGDWFAKVGASIVDGGAAFGESVAVSPDGSTSAVSSASVLTGYSVVSADTMQGALEHARSCPVLVGGGTVTVSAAIDM